MLLPLTKEKFEQIIPLIATGPQYAHYWGKWQDLLKQLLISFVAVIVMFLLGLVLGEGAKPLLLILQVTAGLYWLWGPIYWATMRNLACRKFPYSGFLRCRVLDVFITEELIGEEQTVNKLGELVIIENRERRINLEIGDETGFRAEIQAPLRRIHKALAPGQIAELLVLSNKPDLGKIDKITDAYIPSQNLWIGDYPYLQRDVFAEVSRQLGSDKRQGDGSRRRSVRRKPPRR